MKTAGSHNLLVAEDDQHLSAPRPSCLLICVNILSCLLPAADNLFAGQTAVGKISSWLALNSISHLVNVTKDIMACSLIMTLLAKVMSCLESTWSLTASNLFRKNVAINQHFANYMSHKVKKALVLAMIWVARHLGDEPVLAVGSL